jgi:hypothetical protein
MITDRRTFNLLLPLIALGTAASATGADALGTEPCTQPAGSGGITKGAFADYIAAFNRKDFDGFGKYYAKDVVLELNAGFQLNGQDAILNYYRQVQAHIRENVQVRQVIADGQGLAAELQTEFLCINDWPDFPGGAMKKGDLLRRIGFVHYSLGDGKFTHIKVALFKLLYRGPSA